MADRKRHPSPRIRSDTYRVHFEHGGVAGGAGVVAAVDQHPEARLVNHVAAGRDVRLDARRVDVLHADGAVGAAHPLHALGVTAGQRHTAVNAGALAVRHKDITYMKRAEGF